MTVDDVRRAVSLLAEMFPSHRCYGGCFPLIEVEEDEGWTVLRFAGNDRLAPKETRHHTPTHALRALPEWTAHMHRCEDEAKQRLREEGLWP